MILESSGSRAAAWKSLGLSRGSWESVLLVCFPPPPGEKSCGGDFRSCLRVLNTSVHRTALKMRLLVSCELRVPCAESCVPVAVNVTLISVAVFNSHYLSYGSVC